MIIIRKIRHKKTSALFATYALPSSTSAGQKKRQSELKSEARKLRQQEKRFATDQGYRSSTMRVDKPSLNNVAGNNWQSGSVVGEAQSRRYYQNPEAFTKERQQFDEAFSGAKEKVNQKVHVEPPKVDDLFDSPKKKINPKLLLAGLVGTGVLGAGAMFIRRRRTKNGKIVVEQVRR